MREHRLNQSNAFLENGTMIDLGSFGGSYACAFPGQPITSGVWGYLPCRAISTARLFSVT